MLQEWADRLIDFGEPVDDVLCYKQGVWFMHESEDQWERYTSDDVKRWVKKGERAMPTPVSREAAEALMRQHDLELAD